MFRIPFAGIIRAPFLNPPFEIRLLDSVWGSDCRVLRSKKRDRRGLICYPQLRRISRDRKRIRSEFLCAQSVWPIVLGDNRAAVFNVTEKTWQARPQIFANVERPNTEYHSV